MTDKELLSTYLDGELSPEQVREVEARLAADPLFRTEHLRLQQVAAVLRVECEPDPGFVVRHRERREDLSPVRLWTWRQLGYRLSAAAAALLVAAGLSVWQAEQQGAEPLAGAVRVAEELDLLAFEGEVLAAPDPETGFEAEFQTLAAGDSAAEPVLVIALGGGFLPAGER
ncbi:MAG: hypothetical protein F4Y71_10260 [Acidobacteria bacterium]|nr:hypothetical protein [Acidobacteriota bacterium]MYG75092.1 hypothetical protein [Acidobacteriota bacterium]